jgi:hypothetical protein
VAHRLADHGGAPVANAETLALHTSMLAAER